MYEVRCTMYDCDYSALCAGFGRASADGMSWNYARTEADGAEALGSAYVRFSMYEVQHARRPQAAARQLLMYDVGCTTVADGVCLCTMYDVRLRL